MNQWFWFIVVMLGIIGVVLFSSWLLDKRKKDAEMRASVLSSWPHGQEDNHY